MLARDINISPPESPLSDFSSLPLLVELSLSSSDSGSGSSSEYDSDSFPLLDPSIPTGPVLSELPLISTVPAFLDALGSDVTDLETYVRRGFSPMIISRVSSAIADVFCRLSPDGVHAIAHIDPAFSIAGSAHAVLQWGIHTPGVAPDPRFALARTRWISILLEHSRLSALEPPYL